MFSSGCGVKPSRGAPRLRGLISFRDAGSRVLALLHTFLLGALYCCALHWPIAASSSFEQVFPESISAMRSARKAA